MHIRWRAEWRRRITRRRGERLKISGIVIRVRIAAATSYIGGRRRRRGRIGRFVAIGGSAIADKIDDGVRAGNVRGTSAAKRRRAVDQGDFGGGCTHRNRSG